MKLQETIQVTIRSSSDKTSLGSVEHCVWNKRDRTIRAAKAFALCWILAVGAILIPLLHFILVPLLFLAGPFIFFWVLSQEEVILGGKGHCPDCGKEITIVRSAAKWPLSDLCNHCQASLKVEHITQQYSTG